MIGRRRHLAALGAGIVVFGTVWAGAAQLAVETESLGAGSATVSACDADGVDVAYEISYLGVPASHRVTAVTVGGIALACAGQRLDLSLTGSAGVLGDGSIGALTGWPSESVAITAAPAAADVTGVSIVIHG